MWGCGERKEAPDAAAPRQPTWPSAPVQVSQTEAVIESFWDPSLNAPRRWTATAGGVLEGDWESNRLTWGGGTDRVTECQIERAYDDIDLTNYTQMTLRVRGPVGVQVSVLATIDGKPQTVVDSVPCDNSTQELSGPITGGKLTRLVLAFRSPRGLEKPVVQLRWLLVSQPGQAWTPPADPFAGMLATDVEPRFEPALGIALRGSDIARLRELAETETCKAVWEEARRKARAQMEVDPEKLLRPYSLYNPRRFGRVADEAIDLDCDGLAMALVGMVDRNEDYLRQAARHAVVLARIDQWSEGFIDEFPGGRFGVGSLAQSLAASRSALLLDFCWDYLTPDARTLIRTAIRNKALLRLRGRTAAQGMFGVIANRGVILGYLARVRERDDPRVQVDMRAAQERLSRALTSMIAEDGGFPTGATQGQSAMLHAMLPYQALSNILETPVSELTPASFRDAAWFIYEARRDIPPSLAAFCAGPLGDDAMTGLCLPADLFQPTLEPTLEPTLVGMGLAWAPSLGLRPTRPEPRLLASYPESGWVFMGNTDPAAPRVAFETGLFSSESRSDAHRHAISLDAWGQNLLLSRRPPGSEDARSEDARRTTSYNTLAPGGRQQDAAGNPSRGARLALAEDLGPFAVVESDNATAWQERVRRGQRRLIFVRPNVLVVEDALGLTARETAVQSWNTLGDWNVLYDHACEANVGPAGVRVTCVLPSRVDLKVGDGGGHRVGRQVLPVKRAAFVTSDASNHRLVTVIEAIPPAAVGPAPSVRVIEGKSPVIEIIQGERVTRVATGPVDHDQIPGCRSDGSLTVMTRQGAAVLAAATFDAGMLEVAGRRSEGAGFIKYTPSRQKP